MLAFEELVNLFAKRVTSQSTAFVQRRKVQLPARYRSVETPFLFTLIEFVCRFLSNLVLSRKPLASLLVPVFVGMNDITLYNQLDVMLDSLKLDKLVKDHEIRNVYVSTFTLLSVSS